MRKKQMRKGKVKKRLLSQVHLWLWVLLLWRSCCAWLIFWLSDKAHACPLIDELAGMSISTCFANMHQPNAQICKMLGKDLLSMSVTEFCKVVAKVVVVIVHMKIKILNRESRKGSCWCQKITTCLPSLPTLTGSYKEVSSRVVGREELVSVVEDTDRNQQQQGRGTGRRWSDVCRNHGKPFALPVKSCDDPQIIFSHRFVIIPQSPVNLLGRDLFKLGVH